MSAILALLPPFAEPALLFTSPVAFRRVWEYEMGAQRWQPRAMLQEAMMRPDQVEVSWESGKSKWLVRIVNGEEVIRRFCDLPKGADEKAVTAAAQQTARDEGYDADASVISLRR